MKKAAAGIIYFLSNELVFQASSVLSFFTYLIDWSYVVYSWSSWTQKYEEYVQTKWIEQSDIV